MSYRDYRNKAELAKPQFTSTTTSWWLDANREQLAERVRHEANRLRWSKGANWVSGQSYEGAPSGPDRVIHKVGGK